MFYKCYSSRVILLLKIVLKIWENIKSRFKKIFSKIYSILSLIYNSIFYFFLWNLFYFIFEKSKMGYFKIIFIPTLNFINIFIQRKRVNFSYMISYKWNTKGNTIFQYAHLRTMDEENCLCSSENVCRSRSKTSPFSSYVPRWKFNN